MHMLALYICMLCEQIHLPLFKSKTKKTETSNTMLALIDDSGNKWECICVYESVPANQFIIGGQWKRMVDVRRIQQGDYIKTGAPAPGNKKTLF